ncbi:MAG: hypothetical protein HKO82_06275 [Acidimicrobiia bacterium]|nr:hypothetical protein [Acidimicrobiia bacterium]NNL13280.1 hypothetical protein [Acidimicrobiia bacterium]NNL70014.1 hypothetical protein [Acidimicrobiia bacterium]RZV45948.1 MAG: hypothetical protein EX267_04410 [Acidimicrobiia bacterium]
MGFIASASVLLAGFAWGLRLINAHSPLADGSAALLALSVVVAAAVATLGLVLARGQWARRLALGLLAFQVAMSAVLDLGAWGIIALAATAASIVLVAGPWLDRFLRRLPPAEPIPPAAMMLGLGLVLVPGLLAVSSPGGVEVMHWVAGLGSLATAWAFARALRMGLWSARIVVPLLLIGAALASNVAGTVVALGLAITSVALAWSAPVNRAVTPLLARADGVAVPPQLVPPELLARAGYDDRGRPIPRKR